MMNSLSINPGALDLATLRALWSSRVRLTLDPGTRAVVDAAAAAVQRVVEQGRLTYGINTGFGALARTRIDDARLGDLQRSLVRSHCTGTGPLLDDAVVRLVLALKIASLARGHSGVRVQLIDALVSLVGRDVIPCIPARGSVGASGDLAPLAHLAAVLIGEGSARVAGVTRTGGEALEAAGLAPLTLAPKEGLALLNGTQVSTALALAGLFAAERAFAC